MKRFAKFLMLMAFAASAALSAQAQSTSLTVANGTVTNEYVPIYGYYADELQHNQIVYPASMLAPMNGSYITQLQWYLSTTATSSWGNSVTVSVAIVSDSVMGEDLFTTTLTPVWTGTISGTSSYMVVPFTTPFHYSGGNLLVDIRFNSIGNYADAEFYGITRSDASAMAYGSPLPLSVDDADWYSYEDFLPKTTFTYDPSGSYCVAPTAVAIDSLSSTFVHLSWVGSATSYGLEWDESDVFVPGGGTLGYSSATTYSISGLTPGTEYTLLLWSNCGSMVSDTVTVHFTTEASAVSLFPYTTGFEGDDGDDTGWAFRNGTAANRWVIDSAVNHTAGGSYALYISNNDGVSNSYSNTSMSTVYAYRKLHLTDAGEYTVTFDWRAAGESNFDYLSVYIAPGNTNFVASTLSTSGWTQLGNALCGSSSWNTESEVFSIADTGFFYLVFRWENDYSDGNNPPAAIDNVSVGQAGCAQPRNFAIDSINATEAILTWLSGGTETHWVLSVNDGPWQAVNTMPYTVTGLNHSTNYTFALRSVCSAGDTSIAVTASAWTDCLPIGTLPYVENFESIPTGAGSAFNPCWNKGTSSTTPYPYVDNYNGSHVLHTSCMATNYCYAVMPELESSIAINGLELTFDMRRSTSTTYNGGHMEVALLSGDSWSLGQSYDTIAVLDETSYDFVSHTVSFTDYTGSNRRIAFLFFNANATLYNYVQLDNIDLHVAPTCIQPVGLTLVHAAPDTLVVSWSDPVNNAGNYWVEYRIAGVADTVAWTTLSTTATTAVLDGLNANTAYDIRVSAVCSVGDTSHAVAASFRTDCGSITTLPWTETFDNVTVTATSMMPCWVHLGGGYISTSSSYHHDSGNGLRFNPNSSSVGSILVLPEFNDPIEELEVSFWSRPEGATSGSIGVGYITDISNANTFVQLADYPVSHWTSNASISTWLRIDQTFAGAPAGARIALRHNVSNTSWYWFVDDVNVHVAPSCLPPASVAVANTTCQSLTASIIGMGGSMYRMWLLHNGAVVDSVDISDTAYTFTGLNPLTSYTVTVAVICDDGTLSNTVMANGMTVVCGEDLPYFTGFESDQDVAWTFANGTQANKWYIGSATNNGGSRSMYISSNATANNYNVGSPSSVYAYKSFNVLPGQYSVSFDWKANGESDYDYLRAFVVPGNVTFNAGETNDIGTTGAPAGWMPVDGGSKLNLSATWQNHTDVVTVVDTTTVYLVFYWRNDMTGGNMPPAAIDNVQIEALSCSAPINLVVDSITTTDAYLHWTPLGSESEWLVSVNGGPWQSASTTNYVASGLSASTYCTFAVRALCGVGDTSLAVTTGAYTDCMPIATLPYVQDFEHLDIGAMAAFDPCWDKSTQSYYPFVDSYNGNKVLYALSTGSGYSYAIMPAVDASIDLSDLELSFDMRRADNNSAFGGHLVVAALDTNAWALGQPFDTLAVLDESSYTFVSKYVNLSTYSGTAKRIAFLFFCSGTPYNDVQIDNVDLHLLPDCPRPNMPVVTLVTHDQIGISMSGSTTGNYRVYISAGSFTDSADVMGANTYTFSGLSPMTTYTVSVASNCGTSLSPVMTVSVTTTMTSFSLPYSTGFELAQDTAWMFVNGGQTNQWCFGNATNNGGSRAMYISNTNGVSNNYNTGSDAYVFAYKTLAFDTPGDYIIAYDWKAAGEPNYDYLRVFLVPGNYEVVPANQNGISLTGAPAGWIALDGGTQLSGSGSWQTRTEIVNVATPGSYHLLFYWENDASGGTMPPAAVDNVQVAEMTCPAPLNLAIDLVGSSYVMFHWTPAGSETQWAVDLGSYSTVVNTPMCTVTGLSATTNYTARVRPVCGVGDTGFASLLQFSTVVCDNATVAENFNSSETTTSDYSPVGYSLYNYSYVQTIIPAADLADIAGNINALAFQPTSTAAGSHFTHMDVYMANVSEDNLSTGFIRPDATHTFSHVIVDGDFNFDATTWQMHVLDSAFVWDGVSNVLVAINRGHGSWVSGSSFAAHTDSVARTRYVYSDATSYNIGSVSGGTASTTVGNLRLISCGDECLEPVISIATASDVTVSIEWTTFGTDYYVAITDGTWDDNTVVGTLVSGGVHYFTFTDLNPSTHYTVGVRQICGDDIYSSWGLREITTSDMPCNPVENITVNELTFNSVNISWTPTGTESSWIVRVYNNTFSQTYNATSTSYTATGLTSGVTYNINVQPLCGSNASVEGPWSDPMPFTTDICHPVTGVAVDEIGGTSATVHWNAASAGSGRYRVEYGYTGFDRGYGQVSVASTNSYTMQGLEPNTLYDVYVANICTDNLVSVWSQTVSFETTGAGIADIDDEGNLSIYPNPAGAMVNIGSTMGEADVTVVDMNGRTVASFRMHDGQATLDVSRLAPGAYFVRLTDSHSTAVRKLIVK